MKLLRLHIHGFKSFKDKTVIHFDKGITGIVGPNGCGKSNIVDALFWVMGEQSAKHLRGNKMKDLIFAGSSKYTPATWAEVTLVLLNDNGKHIHIGNQVSKPNEIALTRKLYRNGETEYRINGMPARLKDIQEVFMDTGAGAKSYSIIAQGEINRLVQAKPEERRTMIEEVAGITKFKLRKRDSLKKIESTQANLNRLSDLQSEIYKNLKSLEKQAEKAEKARTLRAKVQKHELITESHREFDYINDFLNAKESLSTREVDLEEFTLKKNQLELALEDERIKKTDLMGKIDGLQSEYNEEAKMLAASEERLKHLKRSREDKEKRIDEKNRENEEIRADILERGERLDELKMQLSDLEGNNPEEMDFSDLEEKVSLMKETLSEKEETISELARELNEKKKLFNEIDQKVFRNTSKLEEYASTLEDISSEIEDIETSSANFSDELINQRAETKTYKEKTIELETKLNSFKNDLQSKQTLLKEKDQALRVLSKEVIQIESKRQSLIEVNKTGEGVKKGALNFIENDEAHSFEVFGNIIECEKEYAPALEALFENSFDSLISKEKNFQDLSAWAKANPLESFDFILPELSHKCSDETMERLKLKGCEDVVSIESILKINNAEFREALSKYFNGFYVASNLTAETALKVSQDIQFKGLVSRDGSLTVVRNPNGIKLQARSEEHKSQGVVQRNNLIHELTEEYEVKKVTLDELETLVVTLTSEVDELKTQVETLTREYNESNSKFIALRSSLESKESSYGNTSNRLEILTNRKNEISKSRLSLIEEEETLSIQKEELESSLSDMEMELSELTENSEELRSQYESERETLLSNQASAKTYHLQLANLNSQIKDAEGQVERYEDKLEANRESLDTLTSEIEEAESTVVTLESENNQTAESLSDKEGFLNLVKDELTSLLTSMQDRENEVKDLTSKINKIEKDSVELNMKVEQIIQDEEILVRDIFDKYRVDLRHSLRTFLEVTTEKLEELNSLDSMFMMEGEDGPIELDRVEYLFEKRFPAVVRESKEKLKRYRTELNRLGEINWQAIEDYDRQKLRYDFLRSQEEELKKSMTDLEMAIAHIDEKSKERFKEAFDMVNERFTKVFPIIFGGGEARLEVVGDIDSIECGIDIIAKPPGKKMQSINLMSGGEKAMTAVSLIFSIFLVKPSPFCLLDEVDAPLDDANVGRFNELLREMSSESQFILITHNKKTMELNDTLYGVTMQEPGVSKAVSVQLH